MGNKAFVNNILDEAISWYSKAIEHAAEDDDELHVYYSNSELHLFIILGAAAYFKTEELEKSLDDANEWLRIKPDFVKGLIRKAQAEFELLKTDDALETISKAIDSDPDNENAKELYEECKQEWDDDHTVAEDNPEKQRFHRLETWLKGGGSKYDKLKIRFYNPIYRGVHAAKRIKVSSHSHISFRQEKKFCWFRKSKS